MENEAYYIEKHEKYLLIRPTTEKLMANYSSDLKEGLLELKAKGVHNIIMDMEKVQYCDSTGLSAILIANRMVQENNACLVICNVQTAVDKLIKLSKLENLLNTTPSFNEAVDFLYMDELEKSLGEDLDDDSLA